MASRTDYEKGLTDFERGLLHNGVPKLPAVEFPLLHGGIKSQMQSDQRPVLALMPDGSGCVGPAWVVEVEKHRIGQRIAAERFERTGENIAGGLGGAVGFWLGGDEGSDIGALFDAMFFIGAEHPLNTQSVVGAPREVAWGAPTYERTSPEPRGTPSEPAAPPAAPVAGSRATDSKLIPPANTGAGERATQNKLVPVKPAKATKPAATTGTIEGPLEVLPSKPAPRRHKIKALLPKQAGGVAPAAHATGASEAESKPSASGSKAAPKRKPTPAAKGGGKTESKRTAGIPSKTRRLPSPAEAEAEVNRSVARDNRGLDPESYVIFENRSLETIANELEARREMLEKAGKGKLVAKINRKILSLSAAEFMKQRQKDGRPALQNTFNRLLKYAESEARQGRRRLLDEKIPDFLKSGPMATRRIDNIEIHFGIDKIGITDTTVIRDDYEAAKLHEFKTLFYGEAIVALLGLDAAETANVTAYEHNPALDIHRPARTTESLPRKKR